MQPKSLKLLEDIREAAAFIQDSTQSIMFERYRADKVLRFAVERNFEIIGEAIKRLAAMDQATAEHIGDHRQIIAFRNVLIHGYDLVDHELVWSTVKNQVPKLLSEVEMLLSRSS